MRVDVDKLKALDEEGILRSCRHKEFPITIYKYTERCAYDRLWDDLTMMCRGLIVHDETGEVIARPFPKFFNVEEHKEESCKLPNLNWGQEFDIMEKMDGCLGIVYVWEGEPYICSVGSFYSFAAVKADEIFRSKGYDKYAGYEPGFTHLFEIVAPETRIVVDYEGKEDLYLLDVIEVETGDFCPIGYRNMIAKDIGCPVPKVYKEKSIAELPVIDNAEGYVIRFKDGTRAKMKFEEYKRLHFLMTGVTTIRIWENLRDGHSLEDFLDDVPDEFYNWVKEQALRIQSAHDDLLEQGKQLYILVDKMTKDIEDEKQRGRAIHEDTKKLQPSVNVGKVARMIRNKKLEDRVGNNYEHWRREVWRMVRPEHALPFVEDET